MHRQFYRNLTDLRMLNLNWLLNSVNYFRPQGKSTLDIQTIARSAYRSCGSQTRPKICASRTQRCTPKFASSPIARVSRTRAWQGDFLIQTKTMACSECITGYSGERDVAWQLIHVRVIHFREPREHSCWYVRSDPLLHCPTLRGCTFVPWAPRHSPRRCTIQTIDATELHPTDDERSRDDLILNQSTAVSRSIYNQPWYESLVTRRPTVRFNENILIDRDGTRLSESLDSLKMWPKRAAIIEIEFRSSYKHDPSSLHRL